MIYTDGVHLISDKSETELHAYADSIGIKPCWFHKGAEHPHYDLPKHMRGKAPPGAKMVSSKEIVRIIRKREKENL